MLHLDEIVADLVDRLARIEDKENVEEEKRKRITRSKAAQTQHMKTRFKN
jgi:hypothetical protein